MGWGCWVWGDWGDALTLTLPRRGRGLWIWMGLGNIRGWDGGVRGDWVGGVYWGVGVEIRGVAGLGWLGVRPHPNPPPEGEGIMDKDGVGDIGGWGVSFDRLRMSWGGGGDALTLTLPRRGRELWIWMG